MMIPTRDGRNCSSAESIEENRYTSVPCRVDDDCGCGSPLQERAFTDLPPKEELDHESVKKVPRDHGAAGPGKPPVAAHLVDEPSRESLDADEILVMTDEVVLCMVRLTLHSSIYKELRHLKADCEGGCVTLQGDLPTYYLKQVAQSVIRTLAGVRDIDNNVNVVNL